MKRIITIVIALATIGLLLAVIENAKGDDGPTKADWEREVEAERSRWKQVDAKCVELWKKASDNVVWQGSLRHDGSDPTIHNSQGKAYNRQATELRVGYFKHWEQWKIENPKAYKLMQTQDKAAVSRHNIAARKNGGGVRKPRFEAFNEMSRNEK